MAAPREWPTTVTPEPGWAANVCSTAESIGVAVLRIPGVKAYSLRRQRTGITHSACSFAKPEWTSTEELTPGKRVESKFSFSMSMSDRSEILFKGH